MAKWKWWQRWLILAVCLPGGWFRGMFVRYLFGTPGLILGGIAMTGLIKAEKARREHQARVEQRMQEQKQQREMQ
jgi:hypothetical protein